MMIFVHDLLTKALLQMCGGGTQPDRSPNSFDDNQWHSLLVTLAQSTVLVAKQKQWCFEIRTAPAFFKRFQVDGILTAISSYGLERQVHSSQEFGQLLLLELEEQLHQHVETRTKECSWLWLRASPNNGMVYVSTATKVQQLRNDGLSACPYCHYWFKGLWWHVQQQHMTSHHTAKEEHAKQTNPLAIIVYHHNLPNVLHSSPVTSSRLVDNQSDRVSLKSGQCGNECDSSAPWQFARSGDVTGLDCWLASNRTIHSLNPESSELFDAATALDDKGAALLHWAAGGGHVGMVAYLVLKCRCDPQVRQVSRRSFGGRTPLHWAARNGHLKVVVYLLEQCHADALAETQDGTTAFGWAAWQGQLDILQYLYHHTPTLIHSINRFGCNAVLWAAQGSFDDNVKVIEWLVLNGCDLFLVNSNGHSLLHKAAQRGRRALVEWIVHRLSSQILQLLHDELTESSSPYDLRVEQLIGPDAEGCTPSDLAGMEHHEDLALYLVQQEEHLFLLHLEQQHQELKKQEQRESSSIPQVRNLLLPAWLQQAKDGPQILMPSGILRWEAGAGVERLREASRASCHLED